MPGKPDYVCSNCGREVGRDNLIVKRAVFKEMGKGGATIKTRTSGWLCTIPNGEMPSCLDQDNDWERPIYSTAPGMAHTVLAAEAGGDEVDEPLFPPIQEVLDLDERLRHV